MDCLETLLAEFGFNSEKKKNKNEPPPVGPFVVKLHLADNAIDIYEDGTDKVKSLKVIHDAIEAYVK